MKPISKGMKAGLDAPNLPIFGGRICYIDNIKFILILFVVLGHFVDKAFPSMFKFIYLFHMPAFVFMNGYVAKEEVKADKKLGLVIMYIISVILFWAFRKYVTGSDVKLYFFNPGAYKGLWYILAMLIWECVLPVFLVFPPAVSIIIAVIIGLLAGCDSTVGLYLSLSRICVFMPFYLMGYYAKKYGILQRLKTKKWTFWVSVAIIVFSILFVIKFGYKIPRYILTCRKPYSKMGMSMIKGISYRSLFYIAATGISFSVFMLIPVTKTFFTLLGRNTFAVYWLHLPIAIWLEDTKKIQFFMNGNMRYLLILLAIFLAFFFSIPFWSKPFNKILTAKYSQLFSKCK